MRGPPMLRLKLLEIYIAELNVLFSLICWSSLEPLNVYTYIYIYVLVLMLRMFIVPPSLKFPSS